MGCSQFSNVFCDFVFDNNLAQLVCGPTHSLGKALDLVLTNVPHLIDNIFIDSRGLTDRYDHFFVTFSIYTSAGHNDCVTHTPSFTYNYSQADYDGLLSCLLQCDFNSVYNCSDIESAYLEFSTIIYQAIDQFVPTVKSCRYHSPKWFTPEIRHLKNCLRTAHKRCNKSVTSTKCLQLESVLQGKMLEAKIKFEADLISNFSKTNKNKIYD